MALGLTIGLPMAGITGKSYAIAMWLVYLPFIALVVRNSHVPGMEPKTPKEYTGFKPKKFYIAFVIECALAFGLPLIGIAAGTLVWWIAVGLAGVIAAYLGITALNRYIDDTNNQIIIDVWGKNLHHRRG